ncbi:PREDICTED: odorant receptor Or2-like [Atta cephalotes]|uniref:Odorant receptor n=1 Tax=Atta cephalotes TaxID=12957 RepID=A0A158NR45_ATTCE|nr:PREDICTED: odorant receptor Or2-like [Atta cephalotes]
MSILKFTLTVLAVAGCWRPTSWTSLFKHMIYNAYTASMIITLYTFAMTQIMELILRADNADTIGDALFNALISLLACYKNGTLMYRAWLPFNSSISALFYLAYAHQIFSLIFIGLIHPTCDNLICGLLLHICCQIEILEYQLILRADNADTIGDALFNALISLLACYKAIAMRINHNSITMLISNLVEKPFKPVDLNENMIREKFDKRITTSNTVSCIQDVMVIASTLAPIFYYCWFGNEIKLKSLQLSDSIYNMEWTMFSNNMKKGLLMIMNRATIPIEFISADIIPVNLDSFIKNTEQNTAEDVRWSNQEIRPHAPTAHIQI